MFHGLNSSGITPTLWHNDYKPSLFTELNENISTDICIIGGGIAGLSMAYHLCRAGKSVIVIEDGHIGSGEISLTTSHLAGGMSNRYYECAMAMNEIERIVQAENIACDFARLDGYLFLSENDKIDTLKNELHAARLAGLNDVELIENPSMTGIKLSSCLRFPNQAQFHPLKFISGLTKAIIAKGGRIFEKTYAQHIDDGKTSTITTHNGKSIHAQQIMRTISETSQTIAKPPVIEDIRRTYVIAARVPKNHVQKAIYWDTGSPHHFIRLHNSLHPGELYDIITIGGESHYLKQSCDPKEKFDLLTAWSHKHIPELGKLEYCWSGQVMEPAIHLAMLDNVDARKSRVSDVV